MKNLACALLIASTFYSPSASEAAPRSVSHEPACVRLEPRSNSANELFNVINNCQSQVIGRFCYEHDPYFGCEQHKYGGFGPLSPGETEGVTGPGKLPTITWVGYCPYDAWLADTCELEDWTP